MDKDEALKLALEALEFIPESGSMLGAHAEAKRLEAITAINKALAQLEPVQVSPLDFVTMTLKKEHLVGRPIIRAQWPNEEKNT